MKCFQTKIHFQELATYFEKVVILNSLDAVLNSGLSSFETFGSQAKRQLFLPEIVRSNFENFLTRYSFHNLLAFSDGHAPIHLIVLHVIATFFV